MKSCLRPSTAKRLQLVFYIKPFSTVTVFGEKLPSPFNYETPAIGLNIKLSSTVKRLNSCIICSRLDEAVRMERSKRDPSASGTHVRAYVRPESPAWTIGGDSVTVWAPSGREVGALELD